MDRAVIGQWCQRGILGLVLGVLVFAPAAFGTVQPWAQVIVQWMVCLALALWAVRLAVEPRAKLLLPPAVWAASAFFAYAIFRYFTADVEYVARQEVTHVGVCFAVFLLVVTNLHGQNAVRALVLTLIFMASVESAYGIYQWAAKSDTVFGFTRPLAYSGRGSGTYINPNHMAGFVEMVLPLALALALMSREPHWLRILLGYLGGVMLLGVLATLSKGGYIATLGSLALMAVVLVLRRRSWWSVAAGGAVALMVFVAYAAMPDELKKRFMEVEKYVGTDAKDTRELIWQSALGVWKEEPWLGAGPNHFDLKFRKHRDVWLQSRPERTHNDHLQILVDWGIVGAVLVLGFVLCLVWGVARSWPFLSRNGGLSDNTNSTRLAMVAGGGFGLLALAIHGIVEFNLAIPANALVAATLLGVVVLHIRFATEGFWVSLGLVGRGVTLLLVTSVVALLGWQGSRKAAEAWHLGRAADQPGENSEKELSLRRATMVEPNNPDTWFLLGENLRYRSFAGDDDFETLALAGMEAFQRVVVLNPFDPYGYARQGMCLSWIGRHDEATPLMAKATELDPNGIHVMAVRGWQQYQAGNLDGALFWFEKALQTPHARDPLVDLMVPTLLKELARKKAAQ